MLTKTSILNFNSDKNCFLSIPHNWLELITNKEVN